MCISCNFNNGTCQPWFSGGMALYGWVRYQKKWPKQAIIKFENSDLPEEPACLNIQSTIIELEYHKMVTLLSTHCKLIRLTMYIFRFTKNSSCKRESQTIWRITKNG